MKTKDLKDGLIMYCAEKEDGSKDFASLTIENGFLVFKFDTGTGENLLYFLDIKCFIDNNQHGKCHGTSKAPVSQL